MEETKHVIINGNVTRKRFIKFAGFSAVSVATFGLISCSDDDPVSVMDPDPAPDPDDESVNLGSGDVGVLNYAYALEQLEAAFYIAVLDSAFSGMSSVEGEILEDLRNHEIAHRDWLKAAISSVAPDDIIPGLTPNFDSVDFSSRDNVLAIAQALEGTGVSAYNGAFGK